MKNIGLKTRLAVATSFLTLLMLGVGWLGYRGMAGGERLLHSTYADQILPLIYLKGTLKNRIL